MKTVDLNRHFEQMLICAVRYALGRQTYIVSDTVEYVLARKYDLSDWCKRTIARDVWDDFDKASKKYGYTVMVRYNYKEWWRLIKALDKEMEAE